MLIELKNITKSYFNDAEMVAREVLKDINLSVSKGDSISIMGPSGSGKSTLLNIMGTLDAPTSGKVFFQDDELGRMPANQLAQIRNQRIGFIFQQHHLLPQLTLFENVWVPLMFEKDKNTRDQALKRAMELIEWVGLTDKMKQLPGQLSVGECQRTAVVRALINNPDVILADEPTGSLDEASALNLVDLLVSLNKTQGVALVMVSHSRELAQKLDVCYKLTAGLLEKV